MALPAGCSMLNVELKASLCFDQKALFTFHVTEWLIRPAANYMPASAYIMLFKVNISNSYVFSRIFEGN